MAEPEMGCCDKFLRKLWTVQQGFGGCDLRTTTVVVAWLSAVTSAIETFNDLADTIMSSILEILEMFPSAQQLIEQETLETTLTVIIFSGLAITIHGALTLITSSMLVIGVHKEMHKLVKFWVVFQIAYFVVILFLNFTAAVGLMTTIRKIIPAEYHGHDGILVVVFILLTTIILSLHGVWAYVIIVVKSYYLQQLNSATASQNVQNDVE